MKEYITTKEQCEKNIEKLGNVVCPYCGRKLQAIETVDNAGIPTYWIGCMHGRNDLGHFTGGVIPDVFETAKKIVLDDWDRQPTIFKDVRTDEEFELWFQDQVQSWCRIISKIKNVEKSDFIPRFSYDMLKENIFKYG